MKFMPIPIDVTVAGPFLLRISILVDVFKFKYLNLSIQMGILVFKKPTRFRGF